MVMLYVAGKPVGSLERNPDVMRSLVETGQPFEFRTEDGRGLGVFQPAKEPACPWEPDMTEADFDRIVAEGGGMPLADFWKTRGPSGPCLLDTTGA